jgi:hypothetical protein
MTHKGHPFDITVHPRFKRRGDINLHQINEVAHEAAKQIWKKTQQPRFDKDYNMNVMIDGDKYWLSWEFLPPINQEENPIFRLKQIRRSR